MPKVPAGLQMRCQTLWVPPSFWAIVACMLLAGCSAPPLLVPGSPTAQPDPLSAMLNPLADCPVTEPVWAKPPEDSAVDGSSQYGYYLVNEDRSMWASAWWTGQAGPYLRAGPEGIKVGWFRPAGATLTISGRRLDGEAPPLEAHVPCCYPTRFQAAGVVFPTAGCWEVIGSAAGSRLSFVVWVEP